MAKETMDGWSRIWGALSGEYMPDRVPVSPMVMSGAAAGLQGVSQGEVYSNYDIALDCLTKTFDQYGGWDQLCGGVFSEDSTYLGGVPYTWQMPGRDIPDDYALQIKEVQTLSLDDLEVIAENGYIPFASEVLRKRLYGWDDKILQQKAAEVDELNKKVWNEFVVKRNTYPAYCTSCLHPFFHFKMGRSLIPFSEDVFRRGDLIERVISKFTDELIGYLLPAVKANPHKHVLIIEESAGAYNYPPEIAERFFFPYARKLVEAFAAEGAVTTFHLDQPWNKNIPQFKKWLNKNTFALQLDGTTDMIAAKQYMGDYCNFQGDVPASLMSLGSADEVSAYCKHLIKEVGYDGRFILINGCECPIDVKPENLEAMLRAAKESFY